MLLILHSHPHCSTDVSFVQLQIIISIQKSFFERLTNDKNSEKFFKVIFDRMKDAQAEIKATLSLTASDSITAKSSETRDVKDDAKKKSKFLDLIAFYLFSWLETVLLWTGCFLFTSSQTPAFLHHSSVHSYNSLFASIPIQFAIPFIRSNSLWRVHLFSKDYWSRFIRTFFISVHLNDPNF